MPASFFDRLRAYYLKVAEVLRGEAEAASVFPNATDIGMSREKVYAEFLRQHAPSKCNVFLGGFLFDEDGVESKQLDIIVTTDTAPRFDFHSRDGQGKSFSPVEGTLAAVSVKSTLDKKELADALKGIASIPPTRSLEKRANPLIRIKNYDDWPLKIIYASSGSTGATLLGRLNDFYVEHPSIPFSRRPNIIHVAGGYLIVRATDDMSVQTRSTGAIETPAAGEYHLFVTDPDLQSIVWTLDQLQQKAMASTHINFSYGQLINKVLDLPDPPSSKTDN
jgi:hypothetical protein